jgi:hypothetical protein
VPGVELLIQEYLAANRELNSRTDLTPLQYERLKKQILYEYRLRCAQERKIVLAQMRADLKFLRPSGEH